MEEQNNIVEGEELVVLYNGEQAPMSECHQFDFGQYAGEWYHESDTSILTVTSGDVGHENDKIYHTDCGDSFHEDEQSDLEIVWSDYNRSYMYMSNSYYGIIDRRGNEGYFSSDQDYVYSENDDKYFVNRDIANEHDYYYCDNASDWLYVDDIQDDDQDSDNEGIVGYHDLERRWACDNDTLWTFGYECEKEDREAKISSDPHELHRQLGFCKESDGSLNSWSGYELVSPVYDLYGDKHEEHLNDPRIKTLVNGSYGRSCGGHIHIGSSMYTPEQIFSGLSSFMPLLYSLYKKRMTEDYARTKKKYQYYNREKRSSVYIQSRTCEFRIFPAIKSCENLLWRVKLLQIMVRNFNSSEREVLKMLTNKKHELHQHIASAVGEDKMMEKVNDFILFSKEWNDFNIDNDDKTIK